MRSSVRFDVGVLLAQGEPVGEVVALKEEEILGSRCRLVEDMDSHALMVVYRGWTAVLPIKGLMMESVVYIEDALRRIEKGDKDGV